jgi:hypothetical protein
VLALALLMMAGEEVNARSYDPLVTAAKSAAGSFRLSEAAEA